MERRDERNISLPHLTAGRRTSPPLRTQRPHRPPPRPPFPQRFYCQGKADKPCRAAHIIWANRSIPLQEEGLFDLQLNHFSGNGMWKGQFQGHVVDWYRVRHSSSHRLPSACARPPAH